ncbi:hypothetical protein EV424DRAFT_1534166 [Suillus variegatus]|nr:hypothetical protein EV424DRAFT_1534166 [Suillus variegatus]
MSPEKQISHLDSQMVHSTPDHFDRYLAGVDDSIQQLATMFDDHWATSNGLESPQSQETDTIMEDAVDKLAEDGPSYNLGWVDIYLPDANLRSGSPVHGGMDIDGDPTESSDIEIIEDDSDGTQTILQVNRRLKMIGNTMIDEHIHAIVENATNGLTATRALADILIDNRNILRGYANMAIRAGSSITPPPSALLFQNVLTSKCRPPHEWWKLSYAQLDDEVDDNVEHADMGFEVCCSVAASAEPKSFAEALHRPDVEQWHQAALEELAAHQSNGTALMAL